MISCEHNRALKSKACQKWFESNVLNAFYVTRIKKVELLEQKVWLLKPTILPSSCLYIVESQYFLKTEQKKLQILLIS